MSVKAKDQTSGDLCKNHSARCDKDFLRVCPSKLSRRELEDLYYSLLENNLELKRAVNSQNERIRNLSTKVQRLSTQNRTSLSREPKECCAAAKVAISEQRASIAELKKANECMAERIRRLNMRLCSAKQFLKRSPNQCVSKCFNCISGASTSVKNLSTSALHDKTDDIDNLRSVGVSAQSVNKKPSSTRTVETNTPEYYDNNEVKTDEVCDENKCRTTMEEFKRRIVDLQEELSKTHTEYSARMSLLEQQVSVLRAARSQSLRAGDDAEIARKLRDASAAAELESQLKLERRKVAEMEMRLKAADMSQQVARTIEQHLSNISQLEEKRRESQNESERCNICMSPRFTFNEVSPDQLPATSKRLNQLTVPEDKNCKSEDSGYAEANRESGKDEDNPDRSSKSLRSKSVEFESYDVVIKEPDVPLIKNIKDYNCVIIDPSKKIIVEIDHVNNDTKVKETFPPSPNLPNEETNQVQDEQLPSSSKQYTESIQSKQQSRFESQLNQKRNRLEQRRLEQTASQHSNKVNLDDVFKVLSTESKLNTYNIDEDNNVDNRVDNDLKSNIYKTDNIKMEEGDIILASYHTIYKNDTQDNVLSTKDTAENNLKGKVQCKCPKCKEDQENVETPCIEWLSGERGNDTEVCQQDEKPLRDQKGAANKRVSHQIMDKELTRRISQEGMSARPTQDTTFDEKSLNMPVKPKNDKHNSLQIPGPLPTDNRDSVASKISKANEKNGSLKASRGKLKNRGISIEGICGNGPTSPTREENNRVKSVINGITIDDDDRQAVSNNMFHYHDSEKKLSFEQNVTEDFGKVSSRNVKNTHGETPLTGPTILAGQEQQFELCAHSATVCTCPGGRSSMPMLRSCSGTQTSTALPPNLVFRRCACAAGTGGGLNTLEQSGVEAKPEASKPNSGNTYNVPEPPEVYKSRATTPENTENEISVMTDLPTERDDTTPRDVLSPGEHKATTTSESYTPVQDQMLSEGEVPNGTNYPKRNVSMSTGEYPGAKLPGDINPYNQESSAQKMEAALQAISQELARCRSLLHSQRPREQRPLSKDAASAAELTSRESITLRKAEAKPRLSGGLTPKCNFTLHVGTIVLSDEAVMLSRDKQLVLSWKFYDQNVTMTRVNPGRVIHFDFSMEYEEKITEEFLEYLKRKEMPITISEMENKERPFATCALPLREALLNANRRADLSLALVGSSPVDSNVPNATDELGVLDLWCMLRVEPRHLTAATMNRDMSMMSGISSLPNPQQSKLAEIMEDDLSNTYRISQDLDIHLNRQKVDPNMTFFGTGDDRDNKDFYSPEPMPMPSSMGQPSVAPSTVRHRSKLSGPSISSDLGMTGYGDRGQAGFDTLGHQEGKPSGIIFSEVNPKIRGLKDSWERNNNVSLPSIEGYDKKDRIRRNTALSGMTNIIDSAAMDENRKSGVWKMTHNEPKDNETPKDNLSIFTDYLTSHRKFQEISVQSDVGLGKKVTIDPNSKVRKSNEKEASTTTEDQILSITVLWLALNEECEAMLNPNVRRLYVAYSFLGRDGAELETPISLPKPKHYVDKCYYNFKKSFRLTKFDMPILDHMAKCRSQSRTVHNSKDCIVFTVVSEPPEDPLGIDSCEDIGYAFLYLGDLLAYCAGDTFTEVLPVRAAHPGGGVSGVLAVRLDGLAVLRRGPPEDG
ncbi:uncharacterized protein isoform X2 [Choristoneura fumiferana]|uniref:uncharacterized protein isoform X2 n=1 Tax=Choristoneura fumiferana TaxID=7141 RepID=UPI003D1538F6